MIKVVIIAAFILIIAFVLKYLASQKSNSQKPKRPDVATKPAVYKENDKIIVVNNVSIDDLRKAITDFCNLYNNESYTSILRMTQISNSKFAVTFPYDIDFPTFCFAVNYLEYPSNIKWNADVRAWTTAKSNDEWITEKSANKKVMLYISAFDKEYDNVFLTTQDNIGYKLGFAGGKEIKLLDTPEKHYEVPAINVYDISKSEFEDFD